MREASHVAIPAFLASRIVARPLVAELATRTEEGGVSSIQVCMQALDHHTQDALD